MIGALLVALLLGAGVSRLITTEEDLPPIVARGEGIQDTVDSAIEQIQARYPDFDVEIRGLGADGILLKVGWVKPPRGADDYVAEIEQRVRDQREALIVLFQAVAAANPQMQNFGAFEDRLLVPIWSRTQIVEAGDPRDYRDFDVYSAFQLSAARKEGYGTIFGDL